MLNVFEPLPRLETVAVILEEEAKLLSLELSIHRKVRQAIDDNQKEYYLREQMKVIQAELGEDGGDEAETYYEKIAASGFPEEIREKLNKELGGF